MADIHSSLTYPVVGLDVKLLHHDPRLSGAISLFPPAVSLRIFLDEVRHVPSSFIDPHCLISPLLVTYPNCQFVVWLSTTICEAISATSNDYGKLDDPPEELVKVEPWNPISSHSIIFNHIQSYSIIFNHIQSHQTPLSHRNFHAQTHLHTKTFTNTL